MQRGDNMHEIKKGDIVSRNSYGNDIIFSVVRIMKNETRIALYNGHGYGNRQKYITQLSRKQSSPRQTVYRIRHRQTRYRWQQRKEYNYVSDEQSFPVLLHTYPTNNPVRWLAMTIY